MLLTLIVCFFAALNSFDAVSICAASLLISARSPLSESAICAALRR